MSSRAVLTHCSVSRESLSHLSCIAFLSPGSVEAVKAELAKPRYGGYWLCESEIFGQYGSATCRKPLIRADFSNTLTKADIESMAELDEMEVVREVQVCFRV
jgi:vacuolar protein sorting-associated protein 45